MNGKMTIAQHKYLADDYLRRAEEYRQIGMTEFQFEACKLAQLHLDACDAMNSETVVTIDEQVHEYQIYGFDSDGRITHAGTHRIKKINAKTAYKIQRDWEAWREKYLKEHEGDYPLRHVRPTVKLHFYKIGNSNVKHVLDVTHN